RKRNYPCVNVFHGHPDNATVGLVDKIEFRGNRNPTGHCPDQRLQDFILYEGILEEDADFRAQIPKSLPGVKDDSLFIGEPRRAWRRRRKCRPCSMKLALLRQELGVDMALSENFVSGLELKFGK
ncbi:hypothetical protein KXX06_000283, partial [Aspergillus fumigatus]